MTTYIVTTWFKKSTRCWELQRQQMHGSDYAAARKDYNARVQAFINLEEDDIEATSIALDRDITGGTITVSEFNYNYSGV